MTPASTNSGTNSDTGASTGVSTGASTGATTDASAPTMAPAVTQSAHIKGTVEYRQGDGPMIAIRRGPVSVQITGTDATLSWTDGETRGSATMPVSIFRNYVSLSAIKLDA